MVHFVVGQRWISEAEPELGLGVVVGVEGRQVDVLFAATDQRRRYATASAPLRRLRFTAGDVIRDRDGISLTIEEAREEDGLLHYDGDGRSIPEQELADSLLAGGPDERLRRGQVDETRLHRLRIEALHQQGRIRGSPVRGFLGARIELIAHQLYIASEVARRHAPRVLLADEVGLGKTIEACLILHRRLLSGRTGRCLILVPESLVHQWFVELVRRFQLWFKLFDAERCTAIREGDPDANPFLEEQLVLASLDFLTADPAEAAAALEADWDLLIVDEAHRLAWSAQEASPGYRLVEALAERTPGVLLLSGTPEQLGEEGHFARLRLLDPARHSTLETFRAEATEFAAVAEVVERIDGGVPLSAEQRDLTLSRDTTGHLADILASVEQGEDGAAALLVAELLDRHGTGRVLFRNTRAAIAGFPRRVPHLIPLSGGREGADRTPVEYGDDPRVGWLLDLLDHIGGEKVLLICHAREQVLALLDAIGRHSQRPVAAFHEGLTILQRDRNAAWFAEAGGAQLLVSSEIGSEGRNFQFARHLVLFDLPRDPELLEQRIGRLDRIGQKGDVEIHVPYLAGTSHEILARWHHEALDDLARSLGGGREIYERMAPDLASLLAEPAPGPDLDARAQDLFARTLRLRDEVTQRLEDGRDRLLERSSFRPASAAIVADSIDAEDEDPTFESHLLRLLEHFGVDVEELSPRTYRFGTDGLFVDAIAGLPPAGMAGTFSRTMALEREDLAFLTRDHPLAVGALELLLGSERGNSSFAVLESDEPKGLLLEAHFVAEILAPARLGMDRFFPPTPIRVVVDHRGEPARLEAERLSDGRPDALLARPEVRSRVLPEMLEAARDRAQGAMGDDLARARSQAEALLLSELDRLHALRAVNDRVREEEIELARAEMEEVLTHLEGARLRLDSTRLVWHGPPAALRA